MNLFETRALTARYGDFQALFGIDLALGEGQVAAIIGANGAGKSTFMRSVVGLIKVAVDQVRFDGTPIGGKPANEIVRRGIALVPEGRRLFPSLSVEENLTIGANAARPGRWNLEEVFALFPILKERRASPGTALSGGQQQMVAIGRALMSNPRLLLCDELSMGLAPTVIKDIYRKVGTIRDSGTALIVVEQDIGQALAVADVVYCFQEGRVSLSGKPSELTRDQITAAYFGVQERR